MEALLIGLISLLGCLALEPLVIRGLNRWQVLDLPNERSNHTAVTPRGGGIAVVVSMGVGLLLAGSGSAQATALFVGAALLGLVGWIDDIRGLGPVTRLAAQVCIGGALGSVMSTRPTSPLLIAACAVWVASYVNAFNFMDGINGISGLTGFVSGVAYTLMGLHFSSEATAAIGAALAGSCMGFLPFNLPRARVFLGDVGSYAVGAAIAGLAALIWLAGAPLVLAIAPTAVYLADTGYTLLRRLKSRKKLSEPHREHVYQHLVSGGVSHWQIALLVAALEAAVVAVVWWSYSEGTLTIGAASVGVMLSIYLASAQRSERTTT